MLTPVPSLPMYRFFTRLRQELGLDLDVQQYLLLLRVWQGGEIAIQKRSDLLAVCQTLWLSRAGMDLQQKFERLFDEELEGDFNGYFGSKKELTAADSSPLPPLDPFKDRDLKEPKDTDSDKENPDNATKPKAPSAADLDEPGPEASIFVQFNTTEGQDAVAQSAAPKKEAPTSRYLFSDKYLPFHSRKLQQSWKYLHNKSKKVKTGVLNIPGCIIKLVQNGALDELEYQYQALSDQRVLVLIDSSHSMVAFEQLAEHLVASLRESLGKEAVTALYFNNVPQAEYLYHADGYRVNAPWQSKKRPDLILVISDAGAAKGNQHKERIEASRKALNEMQASGATVLWLNPMPQARWLSSSALALALQVRMLEVKDLELKQIPSILKRV